MKRTCISTSLLLPVAALYFCVAPASSAAVLEVEPGSSLYYSDEGTGTPILFVPGWTMTSEVFAKRKLTPAELRWITEIMKSTPTGIAVQLAADALFSDYRAELEKLSQEIPTLHVLGEDDAPTAKPWLKENAPKAEVEVLGMHMMFWEDSEAFNKVLSDFLSRSQDEETRKKK